VWLAAVLGIACQQLPSGSDEFGDVDDDDDGSGGSSTFGNEEDDDDGDEADTGDADGGTDDGNPMLDCDPVAQTGCAAGEKCTVIVAGGDTRYECVADDQTLDEYSPCTSSLGTGVDGCLAGLACLSDEMENGLCVEICLDNADCESGICESPPTSNATYCADECSPFESMCPPPMQCRRASDRFVCEFARNADTGATGEACGIQGDEGCAEGYVCLPGELVPTCTSGACCTRVCDTLAPESCDAPAICEPLFEAPSPGNESIGACFVPA
jgi:hypothetical protein